MYNGDWTYLNEGTRHCIAAENVMLPLVDVVGSKFTGLVYPECAL